MEYGIGADVSCTDGSAGKIVALIANPAKRTLAHIAVEVAHQPTDARIVPADLVRTATESGVQLRCSLEELSRLPEFHRIDRVSYGPGNGYPGADVAVPYYGLSEHQAPTIADRIPSGEVAFRRHDRVHATDGAVGQLRGFVVDGDEYITHVLLREGHLWARKEVAIPIGALETIDGDGLHVGLSKREISDLPEIGTRLGEPPAPT